MKNLFLPGFVMAVMVVQSCKSPKAEATAANTDVIPVRVMAIKQDTVTRPIQATGQLTTEDETYLSFKTEGVLKHLFVREGDAVKAGQLLASLEPTEIDAKVQQAMIALEKAERDFKRAEKLYQDSVATLEQMQNSRSALDLARQQVNAAKFNKNYSEIHATRDGYILRKLANEGQIVSPGTPVVQVNGAGKSNWILRVGVSDKEWSAITIGDNARVWLEGQGGEGSSAQVSARSAAADPITGTFFIDLKLTGNTGKATGTGLFGKATITPSNHLTCWSLPYDAILDGNAGEGYVFVSNDSKTAHKAKVRINSIADGHVLVTAGLEDATSIIIAGNAYLNDSSAIKVIQ